MVRPWDWKQLGLERVSQRRLRSMHMPPNPVLIGRKYQEAMNANPGASYADIARQFGVNRISVCQYVTVVRRLPPALVRRISCETDPRAMRRLSLRKLLRIARLKSSSAKTVAFRRLSAVPFSQRGVA